MNRAGLSYYLAISDVETDTMAEDFYTFVDSGDPAPDNRHITGASAAEGFGAEGEMAAYANAHCHLRRHVLHAACRGG